MEFVERLPLKKLHYLLTLKFAEYKTYDKSSSKNDDERKKNYDKMRKFCETFIKANGEIKRLYKFTGNHNWGMEGEGSGRLFADGNGIQGLPKKIRGFLLDGLATDIDMVNAHPVILRYLCRKHNISHDQLNLYIEKRDEVLSQFADRETGKTLFLKALNDEKLNKKEKNEIFKAFDKEMKDIQKILTKLTCYKDIVADVPSNKLYNWHGSAINRIMCFYENKILQLILSELNKMNCVSSHQIKYCCDKPELDGWDEDGRWCKSCNHSFQPCYFSNMEKARTPAIKPTTNGIELCAPMFDGCMVYGIYNEDILVKLEYAIRQQFPELDMKLSLKEHCKDIQMPEDFEIPIVEEKQKLEDLNLFHKVAESFENNHCKIVNKAIFIKEFQNELIVMSKKDLNSAYEHLTHDAWSEIQGKYIPTNFIGAWMKNNPKQRCYDETGVFPEGVECPKNYFNMWRKFDMEFVSEYEHKQKELNVILHHIKILCGHDGEVYQYFIKWIAQMIQFPAIKSICPTLISEEGAGKGSLLKLLRKMMGESKVFETTTPSRDVWGEFNGRMCHTFLINLNELSKKETTECEGRIKGLITDPKLTINNKGVNQYDIDSYHRFIVTTNKSEPINTSNGDRRNLIIRSSDEKCKNKEYFTTLHEMLSDVNVIKTCYEYFKSIPNMDKFHLLPIPTTEYQSNLKELSICPIEQWLEYFTLQNFDREEVELLGSETVALFKDWCKLNAINYEIDARKLGVRISNLKISGIKKGNHTRKGETKLYNIAQLKAHFKLDSCVFKIEPKQEANDEIEEIEDY